MKRRVFVAIPVLDGIKRLIAAWQKEHAAIPVRWIKPDNLHLTVVPPWYATEDELYESAKALERAVTDAVPFTIVFERVLLGPPGQPSRLFWAEANCLASAGNLAKRPRGASKFPGVSPRGRNEGDTPNEFRNLKMSVEKALLQNPKTGFLKQESRPAKLHLTIARFQPRSIKNLPELQERVDWGFEVNEVQLMGSELKRGGAEYTILQKFEILNSKQIPIPQITNPKNVSFRIWSIRILNLSLSGFAAGIPARRA